MYSSTLRDTETLRLVGSYQAAHRKVISALLLPSGDKYGNKHIATQ